MLVTGCFPPGTGGALHIKSQEWHIPLLVRRGGRATRKKVPFRNGADGVVAHTSSFKTHS